MDNLTIWNRTLNANEIAQRNNAPALASITVGTVPTSSQADALRGTDKHSNVRTSMDCDAKTITSVVNNRAEINAVPVTFALTYDDASVTVDGKSFASGDKLDMSKKHTLVIECSDGNGGIVSEKWTLERRFSQIIRFCRGNMPIRISIISTENSGFSRRLMASRDGVGITSMLSARPTWSTGPTKE